MPQETVVSLRESIRARMAELGWGIHELTVAYSQLREGDLKIHPNRYRSAVEQFLQAPERSQYQTVRLCLMALGLSVYVRGPGWKRRLR